MKLKGKFAYIAFFTGLVFFVASFTVSNVVGAENRKNTPIMINLT